MSCEDCPQATVHPDGLRQPDWGVRLFGWSESVVGEPFIWGETDCGSLVKGAVESMYGETPKPWREHTYTSEKEALRVQVQVRGVSGALRSLGAEDVTLAYAQSGDVVVRPPRQGRATFRAGVVVSGTLVVASIEEGVCRVPLDAVDEDSTVLRVPMQLDSA